jgi:hypothetical protein
MKRGFTTKHAAELFLSSVNVSQAKDERVDPTKARTRSLTWLRSGFERRCM